MQVIEPIDRMREICESLRKDGKSIRLVPTMGALHAGHGSLIRTAKGKTGLGVSGGDSCVTDGDDDNDNKRAIVVIVTIFVNPTQFNEAKDFENYPSTLNEDLKFCESLNVDFVFVPKCSDIYPNISSQCKVVPPEGMANQLEGASRGARHFEGVLTIVSKLFNITKPQVAYFGEKDYQQLVLVSQMVRDLNMDVDICPVPTIRDELDMLPLSSRNKRLNAQERKLAPLIYQILDQAREALKEVSTFGEIQNNQTDENVTDSCGNIHDTKLDAILTGSMLTTISLNLAKNEDEIFKVDYLEIRCAKDLSKIRYNDKLGAYDCQLSCLQAKLGDSHCHEGDKQLKTRLLATVTVGEIRLLDNIEVILN